MTTYKLNKEFKGIEITFDGKPSEEIRNRLKANGFRWHHKKGLWYAKENADRLAMAKDLAGEETEFGGQVVDGYMGASAWIGNKSKQFLYGADLSKAIREDIKRCGIKGVSVRVSTYSMGQSITATIKVTEDDFIPFDEWKKGKEIWDFHRCGEVLKNEHWAMISLDDLQALSEEEQAEIFELNARYFYNKQRDDLNIYHWGKQCDSYSADLIHRVEMVQKVITSYRYDDSNSMVDYFDTNFYYDIDLKVA